VHPSEAFLDEIIGSDVIDIHAATIMPVPRRQIRIVSVARFLSRLPRYKTPTPPSYLWSRAFYNRRPPL